MSLRKQAIESASTDAEKRKAVATEQTRQLGRDIREQVVGWFGGDQEVKFLGWVTVDRPHEASGQSMWGVRVVHESVRLFRYEVGGDVVLGVESDYTGSHRIWVETTCCECNERTFYGRTGYSDGRAPWGMTFYPPSGWNAKPEETTLNKAYFRSTALPEFIRDIGAALQAEVRCAGCLLNIPRHCPTCERALR